MRRIFLQIAYDGSGYCGFQEQREGASIEGCLNTALALLLPEERPAVTGASRTDAGVHARGNAVMFDTVSRIPGERFSQALNRYLPDDIRVLRSMEMPADFHVRFTPHTKRYEYRIDPGRIPDPLRVRYTYNYSFPLDLMRMQAAAERLLGTHDFTSFVNPDSQVFQHGGDAVRTIYGIEVLRDGAVGKSVGNGAEDAGGTAEIVVRISGNGFLYHMIRIIVGTLLEVGRGRRSPEDMDRVLEQRDRRAAGPTVPAKGLCLMALDYGEPSGPGAAAGPAE